MALASLAAVRVKKYEQPETRSVSKRTTQNELVQGSRRVFTWGRRGILRESESTLNKYDG
jgi:hypothetical protein